jgi:hypothetical protein
MKTLVCAGLAAFAVAAASLTTTSAYALPGAPGVSAPSDRLVLVKHKKQKKHKDAMPAADDKKAM